MASSAIVIKVKYGETLRRFSASIHEKKLVLDTVMLRAKIRTLFSFEPDVDFTLTYVDEDGDLVTLADDDDLHDVVRQSLNPLRITVTLNSKKPSESSTNSSVNSTPLKSPQVQFPFPAPKAFSEFMKSMPEPLHPLRDSITKLPFEYASKATSSTPVLADLMETMKAAYLNQISENMGAGLQANTGNGGLSVNGQKEKGKNVESSTVKDTKVVDPEAESSNLKKKVEKVRKVTEGVKFKDVKAPNPVDLNVPYFDVESFPSPIIDDVGKNEKNNTTDGVEKKKDVTNGSSTPGAFGTPYDRLMQHLQDRKATEIGGSSSANLPKTTNDSGSFLGSGSGWGQGLANGTSQCPFSGLPLPVESNLHGYHHHRGHHWKRYNHGNGLGSVTFHRGVRCDGCGVHPITGPRFKSKVKDDYDLCSVCFAGMGNIADYIRMDRPIVRQHHVPFKGFHDHSVRIPPPTLPHALRAPGSKLPRSLKLDSRFILDVNVLDGTIMAPFTAFTKIWRMRNNGSVIWPRGSTLQWIGGDRLSNELTVDIEMPADGLPVDKELDVAVDFSAPELPGRYISYWRMASPSGQKFGQRVWVLIQVDASMKDLGETSINLNLPPVTRNTEANDNDNNNAAFIDSILPANNIIKVTDSEVNPQPEDHQEMNFPINDTLIINDTSSPMAAGPTSPSVFNPTQVESALASIPPELNLPWSSSVSSDFYSSPQGFVSYPRVESPVALPTVADPAPPSPTVPVAAPSVPVAQDDRELALVRELEDMGFKQLDLNKEILRMNDYDLEKSIDDLCGVAEWDPMLDELQEMGFADNEANRRLLKKNNGSIKGVVMDLINGEQA